MKAVESGPWAVGSRDQGSGIRHTLYPIPARLREYWLLSKPRVTTLVWLSNGAGLALGAMSGKITPDVGLLFHALLGAWLVIAAANALNQVMEWEYDALMTRTADRPIPARRLKVEEGLAVGVLWGLLGLVELAFFVNPLTAVLGALSLALYVFAYTPLKRRTPFCTAVGAVPGAIPPLAGWAAVQNQLGIEAILLFAVQFLWQFPHFWSIAWLNREDYEKAGFQMLPSRRSDLTGLYAFLYAGMLLPLSLWFVPYTPHGVLYLFGSLNLGLWYALGAFRFWRNPDRMTARRLLMISVLYLPLFLLLLIGTKL